MERSRLDICLNWFDCVFNVLGNMSGASGLGDSPLIQKNLFGGGVIRCVDAEDEVTPASV